LLGDRAQGLGGAYTAISDDASGLVYNPAGLAFALSNDISGSVNAFYSRKVTYKDTLGSDPFIEESNGSVAPFFGILQKLDKYVPGLVGAFGNYFRDSDLKDQDDLYENKTIGTSQIRRFHRSVNLRSSTNYWSAAAGYRVTEKFALGFGLSYFNIDELVQEYQDAKQSVPFNDGSTGWRILSQNVVTRLGVHGLEPVLGFQYVIGTDVSIGLSLRKGFLASQNIQVDTEQRQTILTTAQVDELDQESGFVVGTSSKQSINREKNDNPMGSWPATIRFGAAWFASTRFLLSADVAHYTAVTDAGEIEAFGKAVYNREAVTNVMLGSEFYIVPSFPIRFGLFTNNDARPVVDEAEPNADKNETCANADWAEKYCGQPDHIDYIGESLFIAWVQPNSQIAVGAVLQQGSGKAQKLGDHNVQDVEASSNTFSFSATHNF
jgi:long-chain fatty acid transport protein